MTLVDVRWSDGEHRAQEAQRRDTLARFAVLREQMARQRAEEEAARDRVAWDAYHAAREALVDRPDVRLFTRDGSRPHLVQVCATPDGSDPPVYVSMTVSTGNAAEPTVLAHQARALARTIGRERLSGAELNAGVEVGASVKPERWLA